MASASKSQVSTKKAFKKKPPVLVSDLQHVPGCSLKPDNWGYKIKGFPSIQIEGKISKIFRGNGDNPRFEISLDVADEGCVALESTLQQSLVPLFLTLSMPQHKEEEGRPSKKAKHQQPAVALPTRRVDKYQFESEKDFWGINVGAYGKTPVKLLQNGSFVDSHVTELREGDEVQIICFVTMYDYLNKNEERKSGITLMSSTICHEHNEKSASEVEVEPQAFVHSWKGQTYTL
jgi:hypothetical protein